MGPDAYALLFDIAKVLLVEGDDRLPEILLHRVLQATGAHRGFIAVREEGSFEQKFAVRLDRASHEADRKFSRSLVRRAIETGRIAMFPDADPGSAAEQSVGASGARLALATPLAHEGEVYGVVYLDYLVEAPAAAG